jgi:hypothetical protein
MNHKTITLNVPEELYERVQEAAEASDRSLETVLLESMDVLFRRSPNDLDELLKNLPTYTDAQLWAFVYRRLPWTDSLRLRELIAKGKQGTLNESEEYELNRLSDTVDGDMLLRSEALELLQQRGQDISSYLKMGV